MQYLICHIMVSFIACLSISISVLFYITHEAACELLHDLDFCSQYLTTCCNVWTLYTTIFSSFFFFRKNYLLLSYATSVRPSVEIISFRGNSLPNRPIELKIGLNVREGVVHFRNSNCKLQIYAICNFLQINLCARF